MIFFFCLLEFAYSCFWGYNFSLAVCFFIFPFLNPFFLIIFSLFSCSPSSSFSLLWRSITPHHLDPPFFSLHLSLSTCWFQSQRVEANLRTSALGRKRWCHPFQRRRAGPALSHDTDTVVYVMPSLFKTGSLSYTELPTQHVPPQLLTTEELQFDFHSDTMRQNCFFNKNSVVLTVFMLLLKWFFDRKMIRKAINEELGRCE